MHAVLFRLKQVCGRSLRISALSPRAAILAVLRVYRDNYATPLLAGAQRHGTALGQAGVIGDGTGDLPEIREKWFAREKAKKNDRKAKNFFVPVKEIRDNKFDLSISRYRETKYEEATFDPPQEIMKRLRSLDRDVSRDMDELEALLK